MEKSKDIKAVLCVLIKNNNLYMEEFIEYYYSLGFYKLIFGDNNDIDGERIEYGINKKWIDNGFIEIDNIRGKANVQPSWYNIQYQKLKDKYDWFGFFDQDEFLHLPAYNNDIKLFLSDKKFEDKNCISFLWRLFDDNNLIYYDKRPLVERFTHGCFMREGFTIAIKYIIRGGLPVKISSAHNISNKYENIEHIINCDVFGNILDINYFAQQRIKNNMLPHNTQLTLPDDFDDYKYLFRSIAASHDEQEKYFNCAYIKHFQFKTIQEFIEQKIISGLNHYNGKDLNRLKPWYFFDHNNVTPEKLLYVYNRKEEIKEYLSKHLSFAKHGKDLTDESLFGNYYCQLKNIL